MLISHNISAYIMNVCHVQTSQSVHLSQLDLSASLHNIEGQRQDCSDLNTADGKSHKLCYMQYD